MIFRRFGFSRTGSSPLEAVIRGLLAGAVASFVIVGGVPGDSASASCPLDETNHIIGKDKGRAGNTIGNAGSVYVNDLTGTEHGIVRTMYSGTDAFSNYIEWGWLIGGAYNSGGAHRAFTAYALNGSYSGITLRDNVNRGTWYRFKLQDADRNTVWDFYLDGARKGFTIDHNFSDSGAFAMSERESDCDTGWGNFENLTNCISGGCDTYWNWLDLGCRLDSMDGYKFDKVHSIKFITNEGNAAC